MAQPIRYLNNTDTVDKHGGYFVELLELALEKSRIKYGDYELIPVKVLMRQERQFKSLNTDVIDLMWTVTTKEREQNALPIRIPLLKGLIGYRVLVIDENKLSTFEKIKTLPQLAKLTGVQGHDWPDTLILEQAGLQIERVVWHASMYKLVSGDIVDYFPRSVLEVLEELDRAKDKTLVIDPYHLIVYPSAIYFFTQRENKVLAERIEFGLRQAVEDGSFDKLFLSFPGHKRALEEIPLKDREIYRIDNPFMPEGTPTDEKGLWMPLDS
ncbi:transporter substrate-binding domain-containing protein [Aliiglaciecola sp. LCG003]|uniref:transporter substrate-binding domain-containing protein n=1 Tax=Aliiglaciecola sp. LCG003 TaxID=3053655 RepID=UPI00257447E4|nr:transporter substrate-binding domain-containing protein [Aliiglaciecola sp. LCG003]WJG09811.1 transporter substrate-binding domain-containing protein [Aliiglaciecola sp. LCG003]